LESVARKVAETLKKVGYFDGSRSANVVVEKEGSHTIVTFGAGKSHDMTVQAFYELGRQLAESATGHPLTVRFMHNNLKTEIKVD
jgi:hypothetical protein